jgi:hypothetical protein
MVYVYLTGYISLFVYPFKLVVYLCLPVYLTALSLCLSISLPWPWNRNWGDSASELYSCVSLYSNDSTGPVNRPTDIPTGRQQEISAFKLYCRQQNNYTVYPIDIPNIYKYVQYLNNLLLYRTAKVRNQLLASMSLYVQCSPIFMEYTVQQPTLYIRMYKKLLGDLGRNRQLVIFIERHQKMNNKK